MRKIVILHSSFRISKLFYSVVYLELATINDLAVKMIKNILEFVISVN